VSVPSLIDANNPLVGEAKPAVSIAGTDKFPNNKESPVVAMVIYDIAAYPPPLNTPRVELDKPPTPFVNPVYKSPKLTEFPIVAIVT
jgi:hypothetical protein